MKEDEIRKAFEKDFPLPEGLFWDDDNKTYNTLSEFSMMSQYIHTFIGYEIATEKAQEQIEYFIKDLGRTNKQKEDLEDQIEDTEKALTGAIDCINEMKCCYNCADYFSPKYHCHSIFSISRERHCVCDKWRSK